ncbi:MAG: FtsX-like permease family protein [Ruminococcus sp.]
MYFKLLKNDFRKNPVSNLILFLFMSLSVTIAVTVTLMLTQLFTSITDMYETANPPHFLQMHKGELVQSDIDEFNKSYEGLEHWQTVTMITVNGDVLTVSDEKEKQFSLSDCRLDISLVNQNEKYDVLLDENRNKSEIKTGEIGVPVILLDEFDIAPGDKITLRSGDVSKTFTVTSYVYDGQMNSTLCSSTRFLISDEDFDALLGNVGETEYLIEAYFTDSSLADDYQTAYEQSEKNLPKNGQAITYTMIFLLSALTDLMMAMVFILAGVLLIAIAVVCLRYVVLAQLEDDMREIGTMKAIGIPQKGICRLYLGKIRILMVAGCVTGYILALLSSALLTEHISRTFGEQPLDIKSFILAVIVCIAVYAVILLFTRKILSRLQKSRVTDLLVTEKGFGKAGKIKDGLRKSKHMSLNLLIALKEVRKGYGIIFGLLLIVSFLVIVPLRTVQTMENRQFVTYMGSPICDLLLEVEQGGDLEERKATAEKMLLTESEQGNIESLEALRRVRLQALKNDGEVVGIHIDSGEYSGNGLKYLDGEKPETETEIALSCLVADDLEKSKGDTVILIINGEQQEFTVCGIYQDVTSGGKTAKTVCSFPGEQAEKYTYYINISQSGDSQQLVNILRAKLTGGYSIENMEEFVGQTLGGVSSQVKESAYAVFFIGIALTILIVTLFMKLRIARQGGTLAAKRSMGIPFTAICRQELYPVLIAGGLGTLAGTVLAELFGDNMISVLFEMLGVGLKKLEFAGVSFLQYFVIPVLLLAVLTAVTCVICRRIRKIKIESYFND